MKRERINEIAELIDKRGKISLKQLGEYFPDVSQMTLRRDLFLLEEENRIIRVRGGAMSVQDVQKTSGAPYVKKTATSTDEKIQIAKKVAGLISADTSIFLDAGSTALYLAKEMPDVACTVFTNGIAVATELSKKKNVAVHLLGGPLLKNNLSTVPSVDSVFYKDNEQTNIEIAIVSSPAYSPESEFSCASQSEADLLRAMCQKATFTYMMLDSSKIGRVKPYTFARMDDINVLITDEAFPDSLKDKFKEKNIVVM
jgi:DeoR/GlpR family transcriptional regulator of sugar metabolism